MPETSRRELSNEVKFGDSTAFFVFIFNEIDYNLGTHDGGDEAASQLRAVEPRKGGASHSTRPSATQVQRTSMDAPRCREAAELVRVARRGVGVWWHSGKRYAGQCAVGALARQRRVA